MTILNVMHHPPVVDGHLTVWVVDLTNYASWQLSVLYTPILSLSCPHKPHLFLLIFFHITWLSSHSHVQNVHNMLTGQSWMYKMLLALWMNSVSIWRSWEITVLQRVENWIHIIVEGWSFTQVQMYVYPRNASSLVSFLIVQPLEGLWQDHDVTIPLQYTCCPSAGINDDDDQWESDKDEMDEDMPSPRTTALVHKRPPSRQSSPLSFFLNPSSPTRNGVAHQIGSHSWFCWFQLHYINSKSSNIFSHWHQQYESVFWCIH